MLAGGLVLTSATIWALHATPEAAVAYARVTGGSVVRRVMETGTLQAVTTVAAGAQVSGVVQSLYVPGDHVHDGAQVSVTVAATRPVRFDPARRAR